MITEWDDKCAGLEKSRALEKIWSDTEVRSGGWGGSKTESLDSGSEGWPGVAIDDIWRPLPEEPGRTHGWALILNSLEVNVEVVERVESCSACRCFHLVCCFVFDVLSILCYSAVSASIGSCKPSMCFS
jgi:hypothetical protein